jgi:hypothetical protein
VWNPEKGVDALPLVLCGPMLRRVESNSVTVFVALKEARKVTLQVFAGERADGEGVDKLLEGTRSTIPLGQHLHVVAVTATSPQHTLEPARRYYYQLRFGPPGGDDVPVPDDEPHLFSPNVLVSQLLYADHETLPSFVMPPEDLNELRIIHGSCRKPHAMGQDMMPVLDELVGATVKSSSRPHLLVLTGDQIYADDVADPLLAIIQRVASGLGLPQEKLPNRKGQGGLLAEVYTRIGQRQETASEEAHFTSGEAVSHLFTFAEFAVMYLLVWSDVLWPGKFPTFEEIFPVDVRKIAPVYEQFMRGETYPQSSEAERILTRARRFNDQLVPVAAFAQGTKKVRRALAHLPTLTIFDDHEITDDWYLNRSWVEQAALEPWAGEDGPGSALGRRIIQNGLAAYAIFQGWGNTPGQFAASGDEGEPGRRLLENLAKWQGVEDSTSREIASVLGLPTSLKDGIPQRPEKSLVYHYAVTWERHQLVVLDTRTFREFPDGPDDPAALLRAKDPKQLGDDPVHAMLALAGDVGPEGVTLVVVPGPLIDVPLVERVAKGVVNFLSGAGPADLEAWGFHEAAMSKLLARLFRPGAKDKDGIHRRRVVVLSGDVHYGFAVRLRYSALRPYLSGDERIEGVIGQFVSSPLQNESDQTHLLHSHGAIPFSYELPRSRIVGWENPEDKPFTVGEDYDTPEEEPVVWRLEGSPAVGEMGPLRGLTRDPDWQYDVEFLMHREDDFAVLLRPGDPRQVVAPLPDDPMHALMQFELAAGNLQDYLGTWGSGKEVVGVANLGVVRFSWGAGEHKSVSQTLWWRLPGEQQAAPLTRYSVDLDVSGTLYEPVLYGGWNFRLGDHDATPTGLAVYGGRKQPKPPARKEQHRYVEQLQKDLVELGFACMEPSGTYGRDTRHAVREFQLYARFPLVARERDVQPRPDRYVERLEPVEVPDDRRYRGSIHGVADLATRRLLAFWKENRWRCPVVVEAWTMVDGRPHALAMLPARDGKPARLAQNLWRHDACTEPALGMFAVDLSERFPGEAGPPGPGPSQLTPLGGYEAGPPGLEEWGGPVARPERGHTRRFLGEVLPQFLLPALAPGGMGPGLGTLVTRRGSPEAAAAQLATRQLSTYKVVRAVAEQVSSGYFDAFAANDRSLLRVGPFFWDVGPAEPDEGSMKPPAEWKVKEGQLWAYLAYLRTVEPAAYARVALDYGLSPLGEWGKDGSTLVHPETRVSRTWPARPNDLGDVPRLEDVVAEYDGLRSWHAVYRLAMAGRTEDGYRRRMWPMIRQRIFDILSAPWDPPGATTLPDISGAGTTRRARIQDVFTSERAVAMLLCWHLLEPREVLSGSSPATGPEGSVQARAADPLHAVYERARSALAGAFDAPPPSWGDSQEAALIQALGEQVSGSLQVKAPLERLRQWPQWKNSAGNAISDDNPCGFALPLGELPEAERQLSAARGSFHFDDSHLPRGTS